MDLSVPPANDVEAGECPATRALQLAARKWCGPLLAQLRQRPLRPGELLRRLPGLSPKVLQQELRLLAAAGLVQREERARKPLHVEYSLSPAGAALDAALLPVDDWARRSLAP
jgi:DNA-binding HxlR family transcriptional regulator